MLLCLGISVHRIPSNHTYTYKVALCWINWSIKAGIIYSDRHQISKVSSRGLSHCLPPVFLPEDVRNWTWDFRHPKQMLYHFAMRSSCWHMTLFGEREVLLLHNIVFLAGTFPLKLDYRYGQTWSLFVLIYIQLYTPNPGLSRVVLYHFIPQIGVLCTTSHTIFLLLNPRSTINFRCVR